MDRETAEHFYRWMDYYVPEDEQPEVEQQIHALLNAYPDLIEQGKSWPEMRDLAAAM